MACLGGPNKGGRVTTFLGVVSRTRGMRQVETALPPPADELIVQPYFSGARSTTIPWRRSILTEMEVSPRGRLSLSPFYMKPNEIRCFCLEYRLPGSPDVNMELIYGPAPASPLLRVSHHTADDVNVYLVEGQTRRFLGAIGPEGEGKLPLEPNAQTGAETLTGEEINALDLLKAAWNVYDERRYLMAVTRKPVFPTVTSARRHGLSLWIRQIEEGEP